MTFTVAFNSAQLASYYSATTSLVQRVGSERVQRGGLMGTTPMEHPLKKKVLEVVEEIPQAQMER